MAQIRGREDLVGQITAEEWRAGRRTGLQSWLLTTKSREVAERVAELYQGEAMCAASVGGLYSRKLHAKGIAVIVAGVAHVRRRLVLENEWDLAHACDGSKSLPTMPDEGKFCGHPGDSFERKVAARSGAGSTPYVELVFRLAVAPELGELSFQSSSWQFYESLESISHEEESAGGPAQMELVLREQRLATRSGLDVSFTYPEVCSVRRLPVTKAGLHLAA
ncbi:hypothetical protein [Streptomyces sp. NPDC048106]|uniref:hypothetical protein n=1 Tax=Streptomyces sp. NPDC048106 TaxID=3155750 RepID=UPI0034525EB8